MADQELQQETFTADDLVTFQDAVIELAGEFSHLPLLGIVGALHGAAHLLTAISFESDEEEEQGEGEEGDGD